MISGTIFDLANSEERLKSIEKTLSNSEFWQKDHSEAAELSQERGVLINQLEEWQRYKNDLEELDILTNVALEENDQNSLKDLNLSLIHI